MRNLLALMTGLFASTALLAGPSGNTAAPMMYEDGLYWAGNSDYTLRVGYTGDFVFDRKVETRTNKYKIDDFRVISNAAEITLGLFDRVDLFARLGSAHINARYFDRASTNSEITIETESDFMWALGGRAILYSWDNTHLGLSGQYSRVKPKVERMSEAGASTETPLLKLRHRDWNIALTLAHQLDNVTPYIGVVTGDSKSKFNQSTQTITTAQPLVDLEARNNLGFIVGASMLADKKAALNVEGRFADQNSVAVTFDVRF